MNNLPHMGRERFGKTTGSSKRSLSEELGEEVGEEGLPSVGV